MERTGWLVVNFTLVTFIVWSLNGKMKAAGSSNALNGLMDKLFGDGAFSKLTVPRTHNRSLEVNVEFGLMQILDVDIKNEIYRGNFWISMWWWNEWLSWNPDEYNQTDHVIVPITYFWIPEFFLQDRISDADDKIVYSVANLSYNGHIWWFQDVQLSVACEMDVTYFPFDEQSCSMLFVMFHPVSEVQLRVWTFGRKLQEHYHGEWIITSEESSYVNQTEIMGYNFQGVKVETRVRRQPLYYVANLIIPCVVICLLALTAFILSPEGGDKLGLSITVLLSMTVFQLIVAEQIPPTSQVTPLIGKYFMLLMLLCALSTVAIVFVLSCYHYLPPDPRMPFWARVIVGEWLAWLLLVSKPGEKVTCKSTKRKIAKQPDVEDDENGKAFLLADEKVTSSEKNKTLSAILTELRRITRKMNDDSTAEDIASEWKFTARVLDRFFLWIFILTFVIGSMVIFCQKPSYEDIRNVPYNFTLTNP